MATQAQIICLKTPAFYALLDSCISHIDAEFNLSSANPWIDSTEAMELLSISSRGTLQKYKDEGKIRYSKTGNKNILYDRKSILDFLESHAQNTF